MRIHPSNAARVLGALGLCLVLGSCTVGPRYQKPAPLAAQAPMPVQWQGESWQLAAPADDEPRGEWWRLFHDDKLNDLEQQLLVGNQSLVAARDHLESARSLVRASTAGLFPQLSADPSAYRERGSGNRPLNGAASTSTPYTQNAFTVPFNINYEVDLFGHVRKGIEAANATLQSTAADTANAQLVLSAELAADYFTLRQLDAEVQVVEENSNYQRKALDLVNRRHDGGIANGLDVAEQKSLLDATLTQLSLVKQSRAQYEHAIAVLVGQAATGFHLESAPLTSVPPAVPVGVPSEMLERRPDIASAERLVAAANAQVGLAKAAFYPRISLAGTGGGWQSRDITTLANAPSLFWAVGGDALTPIFSGGRNKANLAAARSGYDASVATYRQSVLTAMQQVEDGLSSLDTLSKASETQAAAVEDARRQLSIANSRYIGGVDTYLDVVTAETILLNNQRLDVQLLGQRMVASVYLVKALGGGWDAKQLEKQKVKPKASQIVQP